LNNHSLTRRKFLLSFLVFALPFDLKKQRLVMTVNGAVIARQLGVSLVHEHVLVDFIGADKISFSRWNRDDVVQTVLPYLLDMKQQGVKTFYECTPAFLGRDVKLLQRLSKETGLHIITNTGYYGAVKNKYLPPWTYNESAEQLAARWISEFHSGIDGTAVRPGFIKISVDSGTPLSDMHKKLVKAAAITHLQTGLTIFSHTGLADAAFEQLQILNDSGVAASAFVWVHAQNEKDVNRFIDAARRGCWISLDGVAWGDINFYVQTLANLKTAGLLHRVLISHDAGWYKPGESQSGYKGYNRIFQELLPELRTAGFTRRDIRRLLENNPAEAMYIRVRGS
jgi:phosphotriesterase-related protein